MAFFNVYFLQSDFTKIPVEDFTGNLTKRMNETDTLEITVYDKLADDLDVSFAVVEDKNGNLLFYGRNLIYKESMDTYGKFTYTLTYEGAPSFLIDSTLLYYPEVYNNDKTPIGRPMTRGDIVNLITAANNATAQDDRLMLYVGEYPEDHIDGLGEACYIDNLEYLKMLCDKDYYYTYHVADNKVYIDIKQWTDAVDKDTAIQIGDNVKSYEYKVDHTQDRGDLVPLGTTVNTQYCGVFSKDSAYGDYDIVFVPGVGYRMCINTEGKAEGTDYNEADWIEVTGYVPSDDATSDRRRITLADKYGANGYTYPFGGRGSNFVDLSGEIKKDTTRGDGEHYIPQYADWAQYGYTDDLISKAQIESLNKVYTDRYRTISIQMVDKYFIGKTGSIMQIGYKYTAHLADRDVDVLLDGYSIDLRDPRNNTYYTSILS